MNLGRRLFALTTLFFLFLMCFKATAQENRIQQDTTYVPIQGVRSVLPKDLFVNYRLPKWKYHLTDFQFSGGNVGILSKNKSWAGEGHNKFSISDLDFALNSEYYSESETHQSIFNYGFSTSNRRFFTSQRATNSWIDTRLQTTDQSRALDLYLDWDLQGFNSNNGFKYFSGSIFSNDLNRTEKTRTRQINLDNNQETKDGTTNRWVTENSGLIVEAGFGFGRIRNVTPLMRSIRLQERMKRLEPSTDWNREQLFQSAYELTRFPAYGQVYDRPEKYFWNDFERNTGIQLPQNDPFNLFYLHDVFNEALGTRLEGQELRFGVQLIASGESEFGTFTQSNGLSLSSSFRKYKNLNANHQLGLQSQVMMIQSFERFGSMGDWLFMNINSFEHLYNIADNMLVQSEALAGLYRAYGSIIYTTGLFTNFIFFHENRIETRLRAGSQFSFDEGAFAHQWQFNVTLRYYLGRRLF